MFPGEYEQHALPLPTGWPEAAPFVRPLRAVLVDADEVARRQLRQLLDAEPGVAVAAECPSGETALEAVARERPHLVFLDLVLPDADGVILGRELGRAARAGLVFVADRPQGALRAFEVHALDYLLKPLQPERLRSTLVHARSVLPEDRREAAAAERLVALLDRRDAERQRRARLLIRRTDGAFFVRTDVIDWIEAAGKLVHVHAGKQVHIQREALARIERHLDPDQFIRISRSAIVNVDRIREIQPWFNGESLIILDDGSQVPTSRHYRANLRRLFGRDHGT
ncbi:MAG TPA: LytTR family DNA-binding domain-containing protein [Gemmatimonadales bacterium]